ncbi:MAG TPA: branched-chain amino acid ABC transporter permease, partial [Chloroflexota bacterium]|nr:branched-chain amino acid ABC transporter permease [Chloroflexota bacterium]
MVDFAYLAQQVINGLQLGFVYALIALGYTMVYGIIRLINFAHGDIFMVGAYVGFFSYVVLGWGFIPGIILAMIVCAVLAVVIEWLAYRPLRNAPRIAALITAIGVSIFLEYFSSLKFVFGPNPRQFPRPFEVVNWQIGGITITSIQIIILVVTLAMLALLQFLVYRTKLGMAM